ncbi:MAG TPA: chemotaxis protein CheA [Candidatus Acidoferrum sp.]|nr:chemotaxis protein CheA [Candidatus Acidoferrum sp.]
MPDFSTDSLFDLFIFETEQNLEQIEQSVLACEKTAAYSKELVDEIFRVMHTVKGSAAMMQYDGISHFAHKMEDLFSILREDSQAQYDVETLTDLVLSSIDFIKSELAKLTAGKSADGDAGELEERIALFAKALRSAKEAPHPPESAAQAVQKEPREGVEPAGEHRYRATVFFEDGCMMENIRAFDIVHKLGELASDITHIPADIIDDDTCVDVIRKNGFTVEFSADLSYDEMTRFFMKQVFLKDLALTERAEGEAPDAREEKQQVGAVPAPEKERLMERETAAPMTSSIISVGVAKLDRLMDLLGELVIAEAMVIHNPEIKKLQLESFQKAAGQLRKITGEMQDLVMSVRMVPLATTFQRMNRIVRDMNRKLGKDVELKIVGEETEVDKNIIDHIADPLMHLVRNSVDHGVESSEERAACGKSQRGAVTLEAKNDGGDVLIIVRDDGRGLDREAIAQRAAERGLLTKPASEMTDKEVYSLIFLPGFSTNDVITEFSGRGVGLDVVVKNIEEVGGRVTVESVKGKGSAFVMKFPLTLAIVEGMNLRVGGSLYTLPITNIRESFRPKAGETFEDPDGNEMIMVRGKCYPVLRLYDLFDIPSDVTDPSEGILIMAENGDNTICLFADELLGQQEVVVKAMPQYIKKTRGLSGCTLLGDGQISLILDVGGIIAARGQP